VDLLAGFEAADGNASRARPVGHKQILFGKYAGAAAGQTLSVAEAELAAGRIVEARKRRAKAMEGARAIWRAIQYGRAYEDPWQELPYLGCWLHDHGAGTIESDYYCERLLEGDWQGEPWPTAKVLDWLAATQPELDTFKAAGAVRVAEAVSVAWDQQSDEPDPDLSRLPPAFALELVADALDPGSAMLYGGLRLVNLSRKTACAFVEAHHSALPYCNPRGMLYALGAVVDGPKGRPTLVAVATAGTPSGAWNSRGCSQHGTLELTRVASVQGLKAKDRRGRVRPLGASSKLTSRLIDLLPQSGRRGERGCRFVTYSLSSEAGTTYLSLAAKGLRPVAFSRGRRTTGARAKAGPQNLAHVDKIVWEAGPAAREPRWDLVPMRQRSGAERAFAQFRDGRDAR
jgi:hypothetical protein